MKKNITVSLDTHPELYSKELNLGLDLTGDMVTIDTKNKIIYRSPVLNSTHILLNRDHPDIEHLFDNEEGK